MHHLHQITQTLCSTVLIRCYVGLPLSPPCASKVGGICAMCNASDASEVLLGLRRTANRRVLVGHQGSV